MLRNTSYTIYTFLIIFLNSKKIYYLKNNILLHNIYYNLLFINLKYFNTQYYLFLFDLFLRLPKSNLKYFKKVKNKRFFLPVLDNIHLVKNFTRLSSLKLLIGCKNMLPMFVSKSGVFSPFLVLKNKKSFWKSLHWSFILNELPFHRLSFYKLTNSIILKSNLLINLTVNIKMKIIKSILFPYWTQSVKYSIINRLHILSKVFNNSLKTNPKFINFFMLNEYTYLLKSLNPKENYKRKIFSFTKPNQFKSVWNYKRSIFYIRHQRAILRKIFYLKGKNYVVTNFVKKLYRNKISGFYSLLKLELQLKFLLIRGRFATTNTESLNLINQGLIYINNTICLNPNYVLKLNDKLQLAFHLSNFTIFRYSYSFLLSNRYKLGVYMSLKSSNKKKNKTQPQPFSGKWVYQHMYNNVKVPKYIEVDYLTLSLVLIYTPVNLKQVFTLNWRHFRSLNIRYYNWKYLY